MIIERMSDEPLNAPAPLSAATAAALHGITALPDRGVIGASGEDAALFLQGQLTQDIEAMPIGQARLAAYCSARGRVLASFIVCRRARNDFWLVCSADLLAATLKKLTMFVLRSKVKLVDATADVAVYGVMGETLYSIAASASPESAEAEFHSYILALLPPADGQPRGLWLAPADTPAPTTGASLTLAQWRWAAVRSGVATVSQAVAEAFVPQMLNYESVDGVNFRKGCYPGQEVVARSQFRGAIKRRAFVGQVDGPAQAGDEVWAAGQTGEPVGLIAQAAAAPGGGTAVMAVLQTAAVEVGTPLTVGGAALGGLHQPYPLIEI